MCSSSSRQKFDVAAESITAVHFLLFRLAILRIHFPRALEMTFDALSIFPRSNYLSPYSKLLGWAVSLYVKLPFRSFTIHGLHCSFSSCGPANCQLGSTDFQCAERVCALYSSSRQSSSLWYTCLLQFLHVCFCLPPGRAGLLGAPPFVVPPPAPVALVIASSILLFCSISCWFCCIILSYFSSAFALVCWISSCVSAAYSSVICSCWACSRTAFALPNPTCLASKA